MKPIITKVTVKDFRSVENDFILLDNVSALVGANESGKTNLLKAIKFVKPPITPDLPTDPFAISLEMDTRMLSTSFENQQFPIIEYELSGIDRLITDEYLKNYIVGQQIESAILTRHGNTITDFSFELSIKTPPYIIVNTQSQSIEIVAEGKTPVTLPPNGWQIFEDYAEYQTSIDELSAAGTIKIHDQSNSREFLKEKIKLEILANIKVFFWTYEEKEIIQDVVPLSEFIANPENFPRISDLFKLGGWDKAKITNFLQNKSGSAYNNLLRKLSKDVTNIIKKSWRQNPNLNIEITHGGTTLNVLIRDNDYGTEYTQRSEGLKWFLSFLIGFRAQTEKFKEYLILFDEPGLHLHPGGQKDILKQINLLAENNQIVYSTHSVFTLDKRFPGRVRLISKEYDKNKYPLTKIKNAINEVDILRDALLRGVLGYSITDVSPISDTNLLVEGVFDRSLIQVSSSRYYTEYGNGIDLNEIAIIACHGSSDISKNAKHLMSKGLQCLCLYDSDTSGSSSRDSNGSFKTNTNKPLIGELVVGAIEMEDVYPSSLFKEKYTEFFVKEYPKIKSPQSTTLDSALKEKAESETKTKDEVKHEFETLLVESLEKYLKTHTYSEDEELSNIKTMVEKLGKLLGRLHNKK